MKNNGQLKLALACIALCGTLPCTQVSAQSVIDISAGTRVVASGSVQVTATVAGIINNGQYTDSTGTLNIATGAAFSGSGTTALHKLVINNVGSSVLNAPVLVDDTASLVAGSLDANNNLFLRSDINERAAIVVSGEITNNVNGLVTRASADTGGCPSFVSDISTNVSGPVMQYQWQSSADSITWSDISGATSPVYTAAVTATGYYRCALSATNTAYTQYTTAKKVIISGPPPSAGVITGPSSGCIGHAAMLADTTSGGTWQSADTLIAVVAGGVVTGVGEGVTTISYSVTNGCGTGHANAPFTTNAMRWTGAESVDWNTAGNWTCGIVPVVTDDITIPVATLAPDIAAAASGNARSIALLAGAAATLNTGAALNVKGTLTNDGVINGNGAVVLNGATVQVIKGNGAVSNITLDNVAGAAIDSGARLVIGNQLAIVSGTLNTHDSLVLASGETGTARIAELPAGASVAGNVQAQQYIQGNYRRYRFIAHPFSGSISLKQLQTYIDITGTGGAANGFTTTGTNAPSAFRYTPLTANASASADPGWKAITKINGTEADSNKLSRYQGLRLFFRGAKGQGLDGLPYTPAPNTITMTGQVNQGPQTVLMRKGTADPANQDINMIGNPYPSPVDIGTVLYNAQQSGNIAGAAFYVWNASLAFAGQYQAIAITGDPYYLQANACFQVRAAHNGDSLNFTESNKGANASAYLFKTSGNYTKLNIYDSSYHLWDMLTIRFDDKATDGDDGRYDAIKLQAADFGFYSIGSNGVKLAIDDRPYNETKVIPLGVSSAYAQQFVIKADDLVLTEGQTLYLRDKLLDKYTSLHAGAEYRFSITKDKATQGDSRFELAMRPATTATGSLRLTICPNPASDNVNVSFTSGKAEEVTVRVSDINGVAVYSKSLGIKQSAAVNIPLVNLAAGIYIVEVAKGSDKLVQKLVKE